MLQALTFTVAEVFSYVIDINFSCYGAATERPMDRTSGRYHFQFSFGLGGGLGGLVLGGEAGVRGEKKAGGLFG